MKTTFKVSYYLRSNYGNKEGKSPVMLRIYLGGEKANLGSTKNTALRVLGGLFLHSRRDQ